MILQVNDVNIENMTNDGAVAKCWDPNPKGYFTIPCTEPVRPIDPGTWVAHTQALAFQDSLYPDISELIKGRLDRNNLEDIAKAMTKPDSGLEILDRTWLKITIPTSFIGADAVNWVLEKCYYFLSDGKKQHCRSTVSLGDTESITSGIAPLPNPPLYMPYSAPYNPSHGNQPIQYGCTYRHISLGSSSSDVLTS